jgi:PKD repeat protein
VAFTAGIRQTFPDLRLSGAGFVNSAGVVYSSGKRNTFPDLRYSGAGFVNSAGTVYSPGKRNTFPDLRLSTGIVFFPGAVFQPAVHLFLSIIPSVDGDDTKRLALGIAVDFVGYPRIGRKPLTVQFEHQCRGPIVEFYWIFGDGKKSYHSDPGTIYKKVGIYDVSLRIRVQNKYYTVKKLRYIQVLEGDLIVSTTDTALRCAITKDQGIGMYRIPVADMPMPEARVGVLSIVDSDGVARGLVLDASTGLWYDVSTREVNGEAIEWMGIGGANLVRSIRFGEDKSKKENEKLRFGEGHLGILPIKEENRNESGYDENGFPDGMEAELKAYVDGEPTTPFAQIRAIPFDGELLVRGDLKTDKKIEAQRIQWELVTNRGAHSITQRQISYILTRKSSVPALRTMVESTYQRELASILLWPAWINGVLRDRRTGAAITGAEAAVQSPGLDSRTGSALKFSTTISLGTCDPGSLFFWLHGSPVEINIGIGVYEPVVHGTVLSAGEWTLYYVNAIESGGLISIVPTAGEVEMFDFRAYQTELSTVSRTYYFDDVEKTGGKVVLPR